MDAEEVELEEAHRFSSPDVSLIAISLCTKLQIFMVHEMIFAYRGCHLR